MNKIKIAIVGMGNCASSLIQGIHYYDGKNPDEVRALMKLFLQNQIVQLFFKKKSQNMMFA